jgi:hypothetical protein
LGSGGCRRAIGHFHDILMIAKLAIDDYTEPVVLTRKEK